MFDSKYKKHKHSSYGNINLTHNKKRNKYMTYMRFNAGKTYNSYSKACFFFLKKSFSLPSRSSWFSVSFKYD